MAALNHSTIIKGFEKLVEEKDSEQFFFDFLKTLKFPAATIKRLREPNGSRNVACVSGDYGLAKQIYFHPAQNGEDLRRAITSLVNSPALQKHQIRFFLTTNFVDVVAYDKRVDDWTSFAFEDLRENYEFFLPLTGLYEKPLAYTSHPADAKACEKMGRLYDIIRTLNHYDASNIHELNVFLTRLLFCFFAEDTGIFLKKGQMTIALESTSQADGSDIPEFFTKLFAILDIPEDDPRRETFPATLQKFPYVNGGLFSECCAIPRMNAKARNLLLECGHLVWSDISPVIFGSMFQSVMDPELRHERGAHYTSEKNILKVIRPLFLDALEDELQGILNLKSNKKKRLLEFQSKLASIKCLDPACGCGNFLVIAYRELKKLELKAVEELLILEEFRQHALLGDWVEKYSKVSINQFYGIELESFPVEVARVSMWLMEHVMNKRFGVLIGEVIPSIPLKHCAHIICANALTTNWENVIPASDLSFIFGNPPFSGSQTMTKEQKQEIRSLYEGSSLAGAIDYVSGWYAKAREIWQQNQKITIAFVSTNSICQGRQVAPIWAPIFGAGMQIHFAHQTFKWTNEAKNNAGVYCVIVGLGARTSSATLFQYDDVRAEPSRLTVSQINGYLFDGNPRLFVQESSRPLSANKKASFGNMPNDGGNLIINAEDLEQFAQISSLLPYIKKLVGSRELLHNQPRYCLWLTNAPDSIKQIPIVADRIEQCRQTRLASKDPGCNRLAERAHEFRDLNNPETAIVIPRVSSERREYIPMDFVGSDVISTDANHIVPNGTLYDFGILESRMHMTWMRTVCGRLKSDYRYSRDLCYNTFAWPKVSDNQRALIANLAENILMTRALHPDMTLAELYDPDKMPADLRKAHCELDVAVEKLYRRKPFANDEERLAHLFKRYEKLVNGEDDSNLFNEA